ncbi:MAG: gluconokinase [Xanthobacteraceae bacterium]
MGVSGSGKTTIGALLADRLHWEFEDGDRFHPRSNIDKMRAGIPLTDEDRASWLRAITERIDDIPGRGGHAVVACSVLKRRYRNVLIDGRRDVRLVYLQGSEALIARRLAARRGHFMPQSLLHSQFEALEEPGADEKPITVSVEAGQSDIVEQIVASLSGGSRRAAPPTD